MKQLINSILVSLILMYLVIAFISLTPDVTEWSYQGRAAYLVFGILFGVAGYGINYDVNKK